MSDHQLRQIKQIPKLPPRNPESHKGNFGKILVVAGSVGMTGAAALVGRSALRAGAGLVRIATSRSAQPVVATIEPSFTSIPLPEDDKGRISQAAIPQILDAAEQNDILAIGPGLGTSGGLRKLIEDLLKIDSTRIVLDADGLNNLSHITDWPAIRQAQLILTPHPGEMARLWKSLFREELPQTRLDQAVQIAQRTSSTLVLKGANTVVTDGTRYYINTTGNPGMATAGSGDVLTGVIAGLWAQLPDPFEAATLAVYTHGLAGDIVAEQKGQISLIATDIVEKLSDAFKRL